jgi:EC042_2821-lke REase
MVSTAPWRRKLSRLRSHIRQLVRTSLSSRSTETAPCTSTTPKASALSSIAWRRRALETSETFCARRSQRIWPTRSRGIFCLSASIARSTRFAYLRGRRPSAGGSAVDEFLVELARASEERADVVVGVAGGDAGSEPVFVERRVDPTKSHPLRQNGLLEEIRSLHGKPFTSYDFQAIVHQYGLREKPNLCWRDEGVNLVRWSRDVIPFIRGLTELEIQQARSALSAYRRSKSRVAA